jgi:membrane protease subunit HflK
MRLQEPHKSHYNPQALYIRDPIIKLSVGKDKDPWGQRNNDGPPDLDELFKNLRDKFGGLLGGGGKGRIPKVPTSSGNLPGIIGFFAVALLVVWALTGIYIVDEGWRGVEYGR